MSHKSSNYVILNVISSNHLCVYIFYTVFISTSVMLRKNISSAYDRKHNYVALKYLEFPWHT